jgi:hypothetical protein
MSTPQVTDVDIAAAGDSAGVGRAMRDYFRRVKGGDVGSLPAVLGLVVLVIIFSVLEGGTFFTALNFANLLNQGTAIIVLAMGLGLRAAPRRDRSLCWLRCRHVRGCPGGFPHQVGLGLATRAHCRTADRPGDRSAHRFPGRTTRHSELCRDAWLRSSGCKASCS